MSLLPRWSGRAAERRTQPLPTASAGVDDGLMERDLLSRVIGDSGRQRLQGQDPRPPPSPTLSLRVATERERQGRAADATNRGHGHEPQQAQAAAAAPPRWPPPPSRVRFAPDGRLASVAVPCYPMYERRHNLRADAGARAQPAARTPVQEQHASPAGPGPGPAPAPQRPPMAPALRSLELAVAGPTVTTGPGQEQERCDACGLSARLLQGLSSDLDRARAQVALLTCQNESLRHRLKRAPVPAAAGPEAEYPAAASAHSSLKCGACRVRPATVQLVPREHLCLCGHCSNSSRDGAAVACPVCRGAVGAWLAEAAPR